MPNIRWTTDPEYEFLHGHLPAWLEHRAKGTLASWIKTIFHDWVAKFDLPEITDVDLEEADGHLWSASFG